MSGEWIPVTERMPEEEDEVLVAWGLSVDVAIFRDGRWFRIPQELTKITHWMPLPAPPTASE